jgi:hypothetical protein
VAAGNAFNIQVVRGKDDATIGLLITSERIGPEARLTVTEIAREAEERLRAYAPCKSGTLKRAIRSNIVAVTRRDPDTGRFMPGRGFEARVNIERAYIYDKHTGNLKTSPHEYAIPVNDGRRALDAAPGNVFVMDKEEMPGRVHSRKMNALGKMKTYYRVKPRSGPVFTRSVQRKSGTFFVEKAQEDVTIKAAEETANFLRRLGRSTAKTRAQRAFDIGVEEFFSGSQRLFGGNTFE